MGGLEACICLEPMVCFFLLIFLLTFFIYLDCHPHGTEWYPTTTNGGRPHHEKKPVRASFNEQLMSIFFLVCSFSCFFSFYFTIDYLCIGTPRARNYESRTRKELQGKVHATYRPFWYCSHNIHHCSASHEIAYQLQTQSLIAMIWRLRKK